MCYTLNKMSRKKILIVSGLIFVGFIFAFWFIKNMKTQKEPVSPLSTFVSPTSQPSEESLKIYEDPSGFSFKYPESLAVAVSPSQEESLYSWLKISSPDREGKIVIKVQDTSLTSIDDWLGNSKEAAGAGLTRDVSLADIAARQIQFPQQKNLTTAAISEGILYQITGPLEEGDTFWNRAQNTIVSSFGFLASQDESGQAKSSGAETIYEEEEVIE